MYDFQRYKIDTLLKMAKTTNSECLREKFIAEADIELQSLSERNGIISSNSIEMFIDECVLFDRSECNSIERTEFYNIYKKYCELKGFEFVTRNVLYRYLRESKMYIQKILNGYIYLVGIKVNLNDNRRD